MRWFSVPHLSTCRRLDLESSLSPLFWLASDYLPFAAPMLACSAAFALFGWRAVRRASSSILLHGIAKDEIAVAGAEPRDLAQPLF